MADTRKLTMKQAAFAGHYVRLLGNGRRAAIAAGYSERSAAEIACENLTKPHVRAAIERQRLRVAARLELSLERVLQKIGEVAALAQDAGDYMAALRGQELLGKAIGLWPDRSAHLNVKVDTSRAHLQALVATVRKRAAK
jgi:phage terminase small subunit